MAQIARCAHPANATIHGVERLPAQNEGRSSMKPVCAFTRTKQTSQIFRRGATSKCFGTQLRIPNNTKLHMQVWKWRSEAQQNVEEPSSSSCSSSSKPVVDPLQLQNSSSEEGILAVDYTGTELVGEDAGVFDVTAQKTSSWLAFTAILGVVLAILYVIWIDPQTGYGGAYIEAISSLTSNHEVVMLIILFTFALVHSGLASLRGVGEKLIGERAFRVLFAASSLPLAVSAVVYFLNHRYDGVQLWDVRTIFGVRELVWAMSFISFFFLYPSTFNLLEVAAVDKPKLHMWETGIMRITRHPQMVGQVLWCFAHTLWIGNSFTLTTSFGLVAHHLFGVWHGDKRLSEKHGEAYEVLKNRTSVIPFAAILDGRQKLPEEYYKEFLRLPYFVIAVITVGAYWSQPILQAASRYLKW